MLRQTGGEGKKTEEQYRREKREELREKREEKQDSKIAR